MAHPFPDLQVYSASGLSFPWAEYNPETVGTFSASLGPDGVGVSMSMLIFWRDLQTAVTQILGYSYRDAPAASMGPGIPAPGTLRRMLPWHHPYFNQCWVKRISRVQGIRMEGVGSRGGDDPFVVASGGGAGPSWPLNLGPWTDFALALLTIDFWRPPYFLRSDSDILVNGVQQEWLRYVDKHWNISTQFLTRESGQFVWKVGQGLPDKSTFQGTVGQKLTHLKLTRKWYQIPEAAVFASLVDPGQSTGISTPSGLPYNLLYTQTPTTNPITGYTYLSGSPIGGCVNSPIGGQPFQDVDPAKRMFGCYMGVLLLEAVEITPSPLQVPPVLMQIPIFAGNEPISQTQYDVTFHFDYFDPPASTNPPLYRGHNTFPFSGNGLWYSAHSQLGIDGVLPYSVSNPAQTLFQYADFSDLFRIL